VTYRKGKIRLCDAIMDYSVYPRTAMDSGNVRRLREAHESGAVLPPPVIDEITKRIADGFNRIRMWRGVMEETAEIDCLFVSCSNDAELFALAVELNSTHGLPLDRSDQAHCACRLEELGVSKKRISALLKMSTKRFEDFFSSHTAVLYGSSDEKVPIKTPILHMAGKRITAEQVKVNASLSGTSQVHKVREVCSLLRSNLMDVKNERLMAGLEELRTLLDEFMAKR
jgi:hypothetical protein